MEIEIKAMLVPVVTPVSASPGDHLIIYNGVCIGVQQRGEPKAEPLHLASPEIPSVRLGSVPSPMQDKVYAHLLVKNDLTVGDLAKIIDVPTGNITSAVNGLLNKGRIVRNKGSKPYTYSVKGNHVVRMRRN